MKPRLNVHIAQNLFEKIELLAKRPNVTKAQVVEAALAGFFSKEFDDQRDGAIIRRLDRIERQLGRIERLLTIQTETLALYIRLFLTVTPPLSNTDQDAARALGKERFDYFVRELGRGIFIGFHRTLTSRMAGAAAQAMRASSSRRNAPVGRQRATVGEAGAGRPRRRSP